MGDAARATPLLEQSLTDMTRVMGADHPSTLTTRGNLAGVYRARGNVAGAARMFEELLTDSLRVLGPDHPDTLTTRHNLASLRSRR